jgi:hypothetical protein
MTAPGAPGGPGTPITLADARRIVNDTVTGCLSTVGGLKLDKYGGEICWKAIDWLEEFEDIKTTKGWTDQNKFQRFKNSLRDDTKDLYKLHVEKSVKPPADWNELKTIINYNLPKGKETYAREHLLGYVQKPGQDVQKYITKKELLCLDFNSLMTENEKMQHIIKGLLPQIKVTIIHKDNNTLNRLRENEEKVERGIRVQGSQEPFLGIEIKERLENNEKSVQSLLDDLRKILLKMDQINETIQEMKRVNNKSSRQDCSHDSNTRDRSYGQQYDRSRERSRDCN